MNINLIGHLVFFAVGTQQHCSTIDYFPTEEYEPDPNDSTNSIPCEY
jgi:hypothetical protein